MCAARGRTPESTTTNPRANVISLHRRLLFVHVPKTGGNSIQSVLLKHADDVVTAEHDYQDGVERFGTRNARYGTGKHAPLWLYRQRIEPEIYESLFKCATVRNPWDRAISAYFSPHRRVHHWDRDAFEGMLGEVPVLRTFICSDAPGDGSLPPTPLGDELDLILRFERLADDFRVLCERIGLRPEPLPRRNASVHDHYSAFYDRELRDVVGARFAEEIEAFGYEFEEAF